ncbi:MAG: von Willebrand factor type A domain-containing protein [Opitutaceae bacterium]|nr:von Willebrand factor type A domain-containing protein [Opitutaceae bacterium]
MMHVPKLSPGDPRLTAYALGELSGDERAAVEAALRQNPALRAAVEEIRAVAGQIEAAFAGDAVPEPIQPDVKPAARRGPFFGRAWPKAIPPRKRRRRVPVAVIEEPEGPGREPAADETARGSVIGFPHFYYLVGVAAAACFALLVTWRAPKTGEAGGPAALAVAGGTVIREVMLSPPHPESVRALANLEERAVPDASAEAPAFVERDLTLLAQARRGEALFGENLAAGLAPRVESPASAAETPAPVVVAVVDPGTAASVPAAPLPSEPPPVERRPIETIAFTAVPPAQPDQLRDNAPLGSLVSGANALALASLTQTGPFGGETVVLSAMRVTANRAVGFAITSDRAGSRGHSGIYDRDLLPRPPPGAKFLRGREAFGFTRDNDFVPVEMTPLSTFSIDVHTASYAAVRRILAQGTPPPRDAVRVEELLNYFPYRYALPQDGSPLAATLEVAAAPWAPQHRLVRIGLKAHEMPAVQRPAASLVFLLDVSSSMNQPNKLPLVKQSLRLLIGRLKPDDRVAIVTYPGQAGLVLPATPVAQARQILNALDALTPDPAHKGSMGIQLAYEVAQSNFLSGGINRIVLCTDGDFDLGIASEGDLLQLVEQKARSGVNLSVLGFGMGNYKDAQLERLAHLGNGSHGYIDTHREAEKRLVEQVGGTLDTVARDVKVQVEFNPARVASYRLIGYENRPLRREDFNLETLDAGEIGAGHTVTALYEVVPLEGAAAGGVGRTDDFRYGGAAAARGTGVANGRDGLDRELLTVKVRYKKPGTFIGWPRSLEFSLVDTARPFRDASADFRFAAAVAQFGMILRNSPHRGAATLDDVAAWASSAAGPGDDPGGYRHEFIELVRKAVTMMD